MKLIILIKMQAPIHHHHNPYCSINLKSYQMPFESLKENLIMQQNNKDSKGFITKYCLS